MYNRPLSEREIGRLKTASRLPETSAVRNPPPRSATDHLRSWYDGGPIGRRILDHGIARADCIVSGIVLPIPTGERGFRLDGGGACMANRGRLFDTTRSYSIATWVRVPRGPWPSSRARMLGSLRGGAVPPFFLYYLPALKRFGFSVTHAARDKDETVTTTQPVSADRWYHLVGVHDANEEELRLYLDGRLVDAQDAPVVWRSSEPLVLGQRVIDDHMQQRFRGDVSQFRVYDRLLTEREVAKLYSCRRSGPCP
jgi:hypothetical protein